MDGSQFDSLTRLFLAGSSRRRLAGIMGALGLSVLGSGVTVEAKHKKHHKKKKKCTPQCSGKACGDDGCGSTCGTCAGGQVCQTGACCVPESLATTCARGCGARTNNCGQPVNCPCAGGLTCLPNGSCAEACLDDNTCPNTCVCSNPNTEGTQFCVKAENECEALTHTCTSSSQCPVGHQCQLTECAPNPMRCLPFCSQ